MSITLKISGHLLALFCAIALTLVFGPIVPVVFIIAALLCGIIHYATRAKRKPYFPALAAAFACLLIAGLSPVMAKPQSGLHPRCNIDWPCAPMLAKAKSESRLRNYSNDLTARAKIARADRYRHVEFGGPLAPGETQRSFLNRGAEVLGGRPAGCPRRFCGCGVSLKVFGRIIPRYNLAANWRDFMPTTPGGGAVAWRPGHVLYVEAHVGGSSYQVYDPNSGGGKIRRHVRNLAGYRFVDPSSPIRRVAGL